MNNNSKFAILLFLIFQLSIFQVGANFCSTTKELSGTRLFTTVGEKHIYYFDDYIQGYNLQYDIDLVDGQDYKKEFSISQGVFYMNEEQEFDDFPISIHLDHLFVNSEDSDSYFAWLATNSKGEYIVRFGEGQKNIPPTFLNNVVLPYKSNMYCYGVLMVTTEKAVVDCALYHSSTEQAWSNLFFVVSNQMIYSEISVNNMYSEAKPFSRKTVRYETSTDYFKQIYIVSGIIFDQIDNDDLEDEYLDFYRFVDIDEVDSSGNPVLGKLISSRPVAKSDLKLQGDLRIADFNAVGNWIYILDHQQGVVFFEYKSNTIKAVSNPISTNLKRWGMSITMFGSTLRMVIAETGFLREYTLNTITSKPVLINTYKIEYQIIGTVEIQCNTDYIVVQQGMYLSAYQRGVTSLNYMKLQDTDVKDFYLWYSNNIFITTKEKISNYLLQKPHFKISPTKERDSFGIILTATSSNFDKQITCQLGLISSVVPKNTKNAYYSDFPEQKNWNYQSSEKTIIPLSIYWVGPNIQYMENDGKNQCGAKSVNSLQAKQKKIEENGDDLLIFINEAQEIDVKFDAGDSKKWVFSKIHAAASIPIIKGEYYYVINQDSSNVMKIFVCKDDIDILTQLDCGEPFAQVQLGSRINTASIGKWGKYDEILALSLVDKPSYVQFYFLFEFSGETEVGQLWYEENIDSFITQTTCTVVDLELYENTLYTVLEGKSSRFVSIASNYDGMRIEGYITIEDVEMWNYSVSYWTPKEVRTSKHHPNILFVLAQKMIYVLSVADHTPQLLSEMLIDTSINTEIIITKNNLVVAQNAENIKEFSLQNLLYLGSKLEFQYQTYEFQFTSPFLIAHGPVTGLIYVLAYESKSVQNLKLLVYQAGTEQLRILVKVIDVEDNVSIDPSSSPIISAGGNNEFDYVFLTYNGKSKFFQSPASENVQLIPLKFVNKDIYVDQIQIKMLMCAYSGTIKEIEHDVTLVNGQTNIIVNQEIIDQQIPKDLYAEEKDQALFNANVKEWYNGSVVEIQIVCEENPEVCGDQITLKNIVSRNDDNAVIKNLNYIYDVQNYSGKLVFLKYDVEKNKQFIGYLSDDGTQEYIYSYLDQDAESGECVHFMPVYDFGEDVNSAFLVLCYDYDIDYYYMQYVYEEGKELSNQTKENGDEDEDEDQDGDDNEDSKVYYLCDLDQEEGAIQRDQYQAFHGGLFVNQISENRGIFIFNTTDPYTITQNKKEITCANLVNMINHRNFVEPIIAPNFTPTSFFVEYQSAITDQKIQQFAKLFVTDSPQNTEPSDRKIWFISLEINNSFKPQMDFNSLDYIVYSSFVNNHELFVNDDTRLKRIQFVDIHEYSTSSADLVIYRAIVMTDNTAMYEMALEFKLDQSDLLKKSSYQSKNSEIMNVYNNYGDAYMFDSIEIFENTLAVAYMNLDTFDAIVALYQLNTETVDSLLKRRERRILSDDSHVPLHTMQGGYVFDLTTTYFDETDASISFALFNNPKFDGASLLTTDFSEELSLIQLDFNPHHIQIETNGKFPDQTVTFHLLSDYSAYTNQFQLKINYGSFKEPSSGLPGWAIALIVIGSLIVLAGVAFFIWKWKFSGPAENTGYQYMQQTQSDAGYSLQEPIKA